jgi:hypothetical protein
MRRIARFRGVVHGLFGTTHNLKVAGSNPAPATKKSRNIKDFKAEHNARLLSFQILVNTWSTFEEAPLKSGPFCAFGGAELYPKLLDLVTDDLLEPVQQEAPIYLAGQCIHFQQIVRDIGAGKARAPFRARFHSQLVSKSPPKPWTGQSMLNLIGCAPSHKTRRPSSGKFSRPPVSVIK